MPDEQSGWEGLKSTRKINCRALSGDHILDVTKHVRGINLIIRGRKDESLYRCMQNVSEAESLCYYTNMYLRRNNMINISILFIFRISVRTIFHSSSHRHVNIIFEMISLALKKPHTTFALLTPVPIYYYSSKPWWWWRIHRKITPNFSECSSRFEPWAPVTFQLCCFNLMSSETSTVLLTS